MAVNERKVMIEDSKAQMESASNLKLRDIIRAEGIAEANRIINESLTDQYIRWLFVDKVTEKENQIIYIPTEASVPITEAGHR